MKREIKFMFDYDCAPIWLIGDDYWDYLVSSDGYFIGIRYILVNARTWKEKTTEIRIPEKRLKGEVELEEKVKLIFETYSRIWEMDISPNSKPFIGFANEKEKNNFYDACEFVIKRMEEIFGDEFSVHESHKRLIQKRTLYPRPNLKPNEGRRAKDF